MLDVNHRSPRIQVTLTQIGRPWDLRLVRNPPAAMAFTLLLRLLVKGAESGYQERVQRVVADHALRATLRTRRAGLRRLGLDINAAVEMTAPSILLATCARLFGVYQLCCSGQHPKRSPPGHTPHVGYGRGTTLAAEFCTC